MGVKVSIECTTGGARMAVFDGENVIDSGPVPARAKGGIEIPADGFVIVAMGEIPPVRIESNDPVPGWVDDSEGEPDGGDETETMTGEDLPPAA